MLLHVLKLEVLPRAKPEMADYLERINFPAAFKRVRMVHRGAYASYIMEWIHTCAEVYHPWRAH